MDLLEATKAALDSGRAMRRMPACRWVKVTKTCGMAFYSFKDPLPGSTKETVAWSACDVVDGEFELEPETEKPKARLPDYSHLTVEEKFRLIAHVAVSLKNEVCGTALGKDPKEFPETAQ